ncbi:hypothetical protein HCK00_04760 [Streptomyces sp. PLAI1-29]|uniref:DNA primase/polymerase bifunctional N-terminal domain-containing protein n=1 Tax=Streptomyces zingiberis TaxID=2053010 RepID=A0ABX1BUG7_9ACTN|nr:hypothetical protein [Streptomyces zingiberis]
MPVGVAWDLVVLPVREGWRAVQILQDLGEAGPVLLTPQGVSVLVPPGSARGWHLPGARILRRPGTVEAPPPRVTAPHTLCRRSWIVPPDGGGTLSDADALWGAYAAALTADGRVGR